jgi:hypothetical protein
MSETDVPKRYKQFIEERVCIFCSKLSLQWQNSYRILHRMILKICISCYRTCPQQFKKSQQIRINNCRHRLERLSKSFAECKILRKDITATATEAERSSVEYFTKDGSLALHEMYPDTSGFIG